MSFKDNEAKAINYWPSDIQTDTSHSFCIHGTLSQQKHCSTHLNRLRNCHLYTKESWPTLLIWVWLLWLLLRAACSLSGMIGLNYKVIIYRPTCSTWVLLQSHALNFPKALCTTAWHVSADPIDLILFTVNSIKVYLLSSKTQEYSRIYSYSHKYLWCTLQ